MQSDYAFLTDHSYSIRVDYDKLPLKQREIKAKKRRRTSIQSSKPSSANHSVSIHRSSSDKENTSSSPADESTARKKTSKNNKSKSSSKKTPTKSRTPTAKKPMTKTTSKSTVKTTPSKIVPKTKSILKPISTHWKETSGISPSLSIEERVKLRRTTPFLDPIKPATHKSKPIKRIHFSKAKRDAPKSNKLFLGSGLDLANIVPGSRQRRSAQT